MCNVKSVYFREIAIFYEKKKTYHSKVKAIVSTTRVQQQRLFLNCKIISQEKEQQHQTTNKIYNPEKRS